MREYKSNIRHIEIFTEVPLLCDVNVDRNIDRTEYGNFKYIMEKKKLKIEC